MIRIALTALLLAAWAQATPLAPTKKQEGNKPFKGPLLDQNFADPAVLKVGSMYYAYSTRSKAFNIPIATSKDFSEWTTGADALPNLPDWAAKGKDKSIWAPDVVQIAPDTFVLYYTSSLAAEKKRCVGVATAKSPAGPFKPEGTGPLICTPPKSKGTVIDPSGFVDPDTKTRYILYRLRDPEDRIMLQRLTPDGLTKDDSQSVELIHVGPDDGGVAEAPSLVKVEGAYVLFYSTHAWNSVDYTISVATATELESAFKPKLKPLMNTAIMQSRGGGKHVSPGGADVLPEGKKVDGGTILSIVFHAAVSAQDVGARQLYVGSVEVKGEEVTLAEKGWWE